MKIFVNGGTGLIGSRVASRLNSNGCDVLAAAPQRGVNSLTGLGLSAAMDGADVLIDLSNSSSFDANASLNFFQRSSANLIASANKAGVKHYVILSVVGARRLPDNGYLRAKLVQENMVKNSGIPYTIVRATQFFEFIGSMMISWSVGNKVIVPQALIQPIAADDVANAIVDAALSAPKNCAFEVAGPQRFRVSQLITKYLAAIDDLRDVQISEEAGYFGAILEEDSLIPESAARLGAVSFDQWIRFKSGIL